VLVEKAQRQRIITECRRSDFLLLFAVFAKCLSENILNALSLL
jgi:hypothetical protein